MKTYIYYYLILSLVLLAGCEVKTSDFKPASGEADFSTFVAIGDSYTAGYTDGALGARGQESSFPNIMAQQFKGVGINGFKQPMISSNGSISGSGTGYMDLKIVNGSLAPVPGEGDMSILSDRLYDSEAPIQNLGVPGALSFHLLGDGYATLNPFFARFASTTATSVIKDAMMMEPSFISLWIGGNDVLSYALAGGEEGAITDPTMFAGYMNMITNTLFAGETTGVIANVPDIESLPFFTHILSDGHLPLLIEDENAPNGFRILLEGEKVLLSASSLLQAGYGQSVEKPLPSNMVLDANELKDIKDAIAAYNTTIKSLCSEYGLAHVDLNGFMAQLSTKGLILDGNAYSSTFVSGGIFSLDGVHVTERGSAIVANEFIKSINTTYKANIPQVDINQYQTVIYP
ncbi:SGNH/GDSL hydrolase family protein [Labilibacter marinus]|uniref:SGNH/GDSL hydrolase family protein n=1 Tax=Labilibacter marinus TaxID=1477105 RepID=UPI0008369E05|nr:SGNH/GDSL hydrolase family protein [Labilibacter marinus]